MCALVPRGQTCWRLGLACVGAQRPDYRWRLGHDTEHPCTNIQSMVDNKIPTSSERRGRVEEGRRGRDTEHPCTLFSRGRLPGSDGGKQQLICNTWWCHADDGSGWVDVCGGW